MTEVIDSPADEYQFGKPMDRKEIQDKIPAYLATGGTIKKITMEEGKYLVTECDVFVSGVGSHPSKSDVKDTKVRTARPEKKFGKR